MHRPFAFLCLLLTMLVSSASAQESGQEQSRSLSLQASGLFKLTRYVKWPAEQLGDAGAPIVIGVLGADPFGEKLDRAVAGQTVRGRPIEIRRFPGPETPEESLRDCHVVYVASPGPSRLDLLLDALHGSSVLTVSDLPRFAERGGVVRLTYDPVRRWIQLEVNRQAAERAQLEPLASLLKLAIIVEPDSRE